MGVQAAVDKGLIYQSNRVLPYSWGGARCRTRDSSRRCHAPVRTRHHRCVRARRQRTHPRRCRHARKILTDHHAVDPALEPHCSPSARTRLRRDARRRRLPLPARRKSPAATAAGAPPRSAPSRVPTSSATPTRSSYFADMAEVDPTKPHHGTERAFQILAGDFIDTSEGTGVVRGPGFGEDDQRVVGKRHRHGRAGRRPGRFTDDVVEWAGQNVPRPTAASSSTCGNGSAGPPRQLHPQLPALLAHRRDHL